MKKLLALISVILLFSLSGCRLSGLDVISDVNSEAVFCISETEDIISQQESSTAVAVSSKASESNTVSDNIVKITNNTETEIQVDVSENEVVAPVEEETVAPIIPPTADAESEITELPEFESETKTELEGSYTYNTAHIAVAESSYYQYSQMTAKEKEAYALFKSAVLSCKNCVDVSKLRIDTEEAMQIVYRFRADNPQFFWLAHTFAFSYDSTNNTLQSVFLFYTDGTAVDYIESTSDENFSVKLMADRNAIVQRQKEVNAAIEGIIGEIDANWSDYRKEKYIHDYVALNMTYDYDAANDPYVSEGVLKPAFDIYSAIINKSGVCEAYAKMFQVLCYAVGINANQVTGVGHMWNVVKIDGEWYQVDVTWDDSESLGSGSTPIRYNYFNLTSEQIMRDGYHTPDGTLYVPDCYSSKYSLRQVS